jgi:lysyl-tRNA synthetase class 1
MKDAKQRGLYEYTVLTAVPQQPGVHVPYRQVAELAMVAPDGAVEEFVTKRLISNGAVAGPSPELTTRIGWAAKWARDANLRVEKTAEPGPPKASQAPPDWDAKTVTALRSFADALGRSKTSDEIQGAAFQSIRSSGTEPSKFFSAIYHILLGTEKGPRLGPYIMDAGQEATANKITGALDNSSKN